MIEIRSVNGDVVAVNRRHIVMVMGVKDEIKPGTVRCFPNRCGVLLVNNVQLVIAEKRDDLMVRIRSGLYDAPVMSKEDIDHSFLDKKIVVPDRAVRPVQ